MSQEHLHIYVTIAQNAKSGCESLVYAEDLSRNGVYWNDSLMGKKNNAFLLSDGDRLRLTSKTTLVYQSTSGPNPHFDLVQEQEMKTSRSRYTVTDRCVGSGASACVFMSIEQTTRTLLACKVVDLRRLNDQGQTRQSIHLPRSAAEVETRKEIEAFRTWAEEQKRMVTTERKLAAYLRQNKILSTLTHPNIISFDKILLSDNSLYMFQDLATAGNLMCYLEVNNHKLTELGIAALIRQILLAVEHLHERNIVHRNLRPEHILLMNRAVGARVVLTGFSSARKIVLTRYSSAAEDATRAAHQMDSLKRTDMWSVGNILILLVSGLNLFEDDCLDNRAMRNALHSFEHSPEWKGISGQLRQFVKCLLTDDGCEATTAKQALAHPWLSKEYHKIDFEELDKGSRQCWQPRAPDFPIVEFIKGMSFRVKSLDCVASDEIGSRSSRTKTNVPVEPPYKPFYYKFHSQVNNWSSKKRSYSETVEELQKANEDWQQKDKPSFWVSKENLRQGESVSIGSEVTECDDRRSQVLSGMNINLLDARSSIEPPLLHRSGSSGDLTFCLGSVSAMSAIADGKAPGSASSLARRPLRYEEAASISAQLPRVIDVNARSSSLKNQSVYPAGAPSYRQPGLFAMQSVSKLRQPFPSPRKTSGMTPRMRELSIFDIATENDESRTNQPETPRQAGRDKPRSISSDLTVTPHSAHLRVVEED
ncbi:hypothetical protein LTR51_003011 [Lithohypha guttulata]|nr:hypothetical protein LTR51_003011 [Lithohypha guttulata]